MVSKSFYVRNGLVVGAASVDAPTGNITTTGTLAASTATFTGVVTAPTPATLDNSTKLATTAFVQSAVAAAGGVSITSSATAPVSPKAGAEWYDTSSGTLYQYISDGTGSYWIDITGPTATTQSLSSTVIAGGSIDGTVIGTAAAAAASFTNLYYTGTLTGGTGVVNIGAGQIYKDASGNLGIGTANPSASVSNSGLALFGTYGTTSTAFSIQNSSASSASNVSRISFKSNNTFGGAEAVASIDGVNPNASANNGGALVFNVSANGTATLPTERARITSTGNLGIGTSAPTYRLQIASNGFPGMGLYRDVDVSSVGAAGQSFEIGARVGTNFVPGAAIIGQLDNPAGATGGLQFQVRNGNVLLEVARFDYNGGLLVGCKSTPNATNPGFGINVSDGNGDLSIVCAGGDTGGNRQIAFYNPNGMVGSITTNGSTTNYLTSSDYRLKNTILPMTGALDKVALLKPCTYKWNADNSDGQGFIAHELAEVEPGCVAGDKDALDAQGKPKYQGIDTSFLVATLTAAIQELNAIIDAQSIRIAALENK